MQYRVAFDLLLESSEQLTNPAIREDFLVAAKTFVPWYQEGRYYHHRACSNRPDLSCLVHAPLQDHWDERCLACPSALDAYVPLDGAKQLAKAVMLVRASRVVLGAPTVGLAQFFQAALGGLARLQPNAFSLELLTRVRSREEVLWVYLKKNAGGVLAQHAAVHTAAPHKGPVLLAVPASVPRPAGYYQKAAGYWRKEHAGDLDSALASLRADFPGDAVREAYAQELYVLLQERYHAALQDGTVQMVAVPACVLENSGMQVLSDVIAASGVRVRDQYFVEVRGGTLAYLQQLFGVYLAEFGVVTEADTEAVKETVRALYAGAAHGLNFRRVAADRSVLTDPQGALNAARMLN